MYSTLQMHNTSEAAHFRPDRHPFIQLDLEDGRPGEIHETQTEAEADRGLMKSSHKKEEILQMQPQVEEEEELFSGVVFFTGCENQRENFFMIPEHESRPGYHPTRRREFNVDGFWFKYHTPKNEWWKVPGLATTYVDCNPDDERNPHIRPAIILPLLTSGWTDDHIHTPNPF